MKGQFFLPKMQQHRPACTRHLCIGDIRWFRIVIAIVALALIQAASTSASPALAQHLSPSSGDPAAANLLPWFRQAIDGAGGQMRGRFASLALDEATQIPYISYIDDTNANLMLAHPVPTGGNCGPRNSWLCEVVDGDGVGNHRDAEVGASSTLAFFRSSEFVRQIGIAYLDNTNGELRYAQLLCTALSCTWTYETIIEDPNAVFTSIQFDSTGTPHVAYHHMSTGAPDDFRGLMYASRTNEGWYIILVETATGPNATGYTPSLAFSENDVPHIAYYSPQEGALKLAYPSSLPGGCNPSASWQCDTIDGDLYHPVGLYPSLHIENPPVANKPEGPSGGSQITRIAYYDQTDGVLKYATSRGDVPNCGPLFNGSPYWQCDEIAAMSGDLEQMQEISLEVDPIGYPVIVYTVASSAQHPASLDIARPTLALHTLGNCGPLSSSPFPLPTWKCSALDTTPIGASADFIYTFVSMTLNTDGMGYAAYYEQDTASGDGRLKLAYQRFGAYLPTIVR